MTHPNRFFTVLLAIIAPLLAFGQPIKVTPRVMTPELRAQVAAPALNGFYRGNDGGYYYLRQDGNTVYWFGEHPGGGWANVMKGALDGNTLQGQWYDVPKGGGKGKGAITLTLAADRKTFTRAAATGGFGGSQWTQAALPANVPGERAAGYGATTAEDLTGRWEANDGGVYYLRQDGNTVVWFGEQKTGSGRPAFANVAFGARSGNVVRLEWADVAKCGLNGKGTLQLQVNSAGEMVRTGGGGFGGSKWTRAVAARFNPVLTTVAVNPAVLKRNLQLTDAYKQQSAKNNATSMVLLPVDRVKYIPPQAGGAKPAEPAAPSTDIEGPNVMLGQDLSGLFGDPRFVSFVEKLNLFRELYQDKNPNSGFFYYLPANYNLKWDPETGRYSFYIYYLSAGDGGRGDVIITAELTPSISRQDVELAERYLSGKLKKDIKLRPIILKDTPHVTFGNALRNFDVDAESISTSVPTDFLQPIVVSWRMNSRVDDLIGAMMNNIGISGNVEFLPYGEMEKVITVPVKMKINDPQTYGKLEYTDAAALLNGFYNKMDYPVVLTDLVVLRGQNNQVQTVDRIPLNNYAVEPKMLFSAFTDEERGKVLGGGLITKLWANYALRPCDPCDEAVRGKILGGTANSRVRGIEVQVLTPLAYAGANSIKLVIKSRQGDPNGKSEVLLPVVTIGQDNQTLAGGELFVDEGAEPAYEYQLVLVMPDGEVRASEWIPSRELFIVIGESTIRQYLEGGE